MSTASELLTCALSFLIGWILCSLRAEQKIRLLRIALFELINELAHYKEEHTPTENLHAHAHTTRNAHQQHNTLN